MGYRAEEQIIESRGMERARCEWRDAIDSDGSPVEIKAAMRHRSNGSEGRFRIFREPHRQLAREDGRYVFAAYRIRGTGVEILATTAKAARAVRVDSWTKAGHETDGREHQQRIPISEVF